MFYTIEKESILLKVALFLNYLINGTYWAYLNVFLHSIGLSIDKVGLISGIRLLFTMLGNGLTMIGENDKRKVFVLFALAFGSVITVFPSPWVAYIVCPQSKNCLNQFSLNINSTDNQSYNNSSLVVACYEEEKCQDKLFYIMMVLFCSSAIFEWSLISYVDSLVLTLCNARNSSFAIQRFFGEAGYAFGVFICGLSAEYIRIGDYSPYTIVYIIYLACVAALLPVCVKVIKDIRYSKNHTSDSGEIMLKKSTEKVDKIKLFKESFFNIRTLVFFIMITFGGISQSIVNGYLFLLVEKVLKESKTVLSLTYLISLFTCAIVVNLSDKIISVLGGTLEAMTFAMLCSSLRFFAYWLSDSYWWVYGAQILQPISIILLIIAKMKHLSLEIPSEILVTVTCLLTTWFYGACYFIGGVAGGQIAYRYGLRSLMLCTALLCVFSTLIGAVYICVSRRKTVLVETPQRKVKETE